MVNRNFASPGGFGRTAGNPALADRQRIVAECRRVVGRGFLRAGLISGFINLLQLTVPLFMLQVHDRILASHSIDSLRMLVLLSVGAIALYGILEYVRSLLFQATAAAVIGKLNVPSIEAALALAVEQGSARGTEVLRDLSELRAFLTGNAFTAPFEAMWSPLFLAVMFAFHPLYGLIGIISIIILVGLGLLSDLICRGVLKEASAAQVESIAMIGSTLRHAEAIEGMGMLPALLRRWHRAHVGAVELLYQGTRRSKAMHALTRSLRYMMQIAVLAVGAWLIINQVASPGSMIGGTMIMGRLLLPFDTITADWRAWVFAGASWRRIRGILEQSRSPRDSLPVPRPAGDLVVDRLVFAPPGAAVPVLKGISFSLSPGEALGVAGPSGAGKSTLARLLVGVLKPTSGGIYLDGHGTYLWERESFGDAVGYVPQQVSLLDGTVRDNIARFRDADPREVIDAARAAGVHEVIGRLPLGYDTPVGEAALTLSGGQKQRLALARALFGRPSLIVLDEPNSNLDAQGEASLVAAIGEAKRWGAMVVVIAHRQSVMQAVDRLLILQEGRVVDIAEARARAQAAAPLAVPQPKRAPRAAARQEA